MDKKKFVNTAAALEEINLAVERLKKSVESKRSALLQQRQSYKQNAAEKNARLAQFRQTAADALIKVENMAQKIDMVLSENGSSNNHN